MKKLGIIVALSFWNFVAFVPGTFAASAQSYMETSPSELLAISEQLISENRLGDAKRILNISPFSSRELEIERLYILAKIYSAEDNIDAAIKIYRFILDEQPELAKVRLELAICYIKKHQWIRADYHLRLAMTDDSVPPQIKSAMSQMRYLIRQNKNWNFFFDFGAAPDTNINSAVGGSECIGTAVGVLCRHLPEPEKVIGFNFSVGGDYEFKLSDQWRWKNAGFLYLNSYDKSEFDDLYLGVQSGPRFVYDRGSVWIAATANRRFYGHNPYSYGVGGLLSADYDFTNRLSGGISVSYTINSYDDYGDFMDGGATSANGQISYSFDASKYIILRGGIARETAIVATYANWRESLGLGFGMELPFGFNAYVESSVYWMDFDGARLVIKDNNLMDIIESTFTQRHSVSLSNNKLTVWGFMPTLTYAYTRRDSNIWQREFSKNSLEFSMRQKF